MSDPVFFRLAASAALANIIAWTDAEGYESAFQQGLATLQPTGKLIGVEGLYLRFFEGELIRRHAPKAEVVAVDTPLARLRLELQGLYLAAWQSHLWNRMLARWLHMHLASAQRMLIRLQHMER